MIVTDTNNTVKLNIPYFDVDLTMYLHAEGDAMISARIQQDKHWELYETQLTLQHLQAGDVYVDVGANIGYYSLLAAKKVGSSGKVIAYEPNPKNFALLQANIALNHLPNVQVFPLALYDKDEQGQLYLSADNYGDHRVYAASESRHSHDITLVHGDEHLSTLTSRMDFLKIDTQGAEFFVVNGLHDMIMHNRQHLRMIVEFCPYGIHNSGADGLALLALLDATGMQYHIIDHQQQCLIPAQSYHLSDWIKQMAAEPLNEGFINLLVTPANYVV